MWKVTILIKKNEIPKNGRIVKCGICNLEWLQKPHGAVRKKLLERNTILLIYFFNFVVNISFCWCNDYF